MLNKSLPIIFMTRPIGVITRKKTIPITMGAIIDPKIIPNLAHSRFNGVKSFDLVNTKIKKAKEIMADQILGDSL